MNILYVNHSMGMGGIEKMILDFVCYFSSRGHTVSVAVFAAGGSLESKLEALGVPIHYLKKKDGVDIGLFFRVAKLVRDGKVDVVHTNNYACLVYAFFASLAYRKTCFVHTEHSLVRGQKKRRYIVEKFCSLPYDQIVAVSDDVSRLLVSKVGLRRRNIKVIRNGVDVNKFIPTADKAKKRMGFGLPEGGFLVGSVGRLVPVKDHKTMIRALGVCMQHTSKISLVIAGDGPLRADLSELIKAEGLEQNVYMLGNVDDVPALLASLDLYLITSISEGFSISLLEAMSAELPVVATRVGGNPELIDDNSSGHLVEVGDVAAIANEILELSQNSEKSKAFGRRARQKIVAGFSSEHMLQKYHLLYSK